MNIFGIPPEWRDKPQVNKNENREDREEEDIRAEIQRLITRINELKHEIDRFIREKGRKGRELYPMLIEELKDASEELKTVLDSVNKLYLS